MKHHLLAWIIWGCICLVASGPAGADEPATASDDTVEDEFLDENLDFLDEEEDEEIPPVADPLEPWNRAMFKFNDDMYFGVLKPVARGYRFVVPDEIRLVVKNLFYYIGTPMRLANCLLQGKMKAFGAEFGRFFINTSVGMMGVWNPAKNFPELNPDEEDLGQTLGHWGIGNGPYIVWPFLGPSTLRDSTGFAGDWLYTRYIYTLSRGAAIGLYAVESVNETTFRIGDYETLKEAALDPYRALRDGYIQYRLLKIRN